MKYFRLALMKDKKISVKGAWRYTIYREDVYVCVAKNETEARKKFRKSYPEIGNARIRVLGFQEVDPDLNTYEEFYGLDIDPLCYEKSYLNYVYFRGEVILCWDDDMACNCPEDMIWDRELGDIFAAGVALGRKIKELEIGNAE